AMGRADLWMIAILGAVSLAILFLLWKEFKVYTFDPLFAHGLGLKTRRLDDLLIVILVIGIVIGIQAVGVVLMIALLITPASAARQWTRHLGPMVLLAAFFGALCGTAGSLVSALGTGLPTGPLIVLAATIVFVVSLVFAPRRGLVAKARNRQRTRKALVSGGAS
ncbi:MAG: metal ABC transporter permease, partial [Planctomycetota bacterium]